MPSEEKPAAVQGPRKRHGRSPKFPSIDFVTAVAFTSEIYEHEHAHPVSMTTAAQHLGHKSASGPARAKIGALKRYGLVVSEGGDVIRVTDVGQRLALLPRESDEWQELAAQQALAPAIFKKVKAKFEGPLPSDRNLRTTLIVDLGFQPAGADSFISVLRANHEFVENLSASTGGQDQPEVEQSTDRSGEPAPNGPVHPAWESEVSLLPPSPVRRVPAAEDAVVANYPLGDGRSVRIISDGPLDRRQVRKLVRLLSITFDLEESD